jgi:hypothetical protein
LESITNSKMKGSMSFSSMLFVLVILELVPHLVQSIRLVAMEQRATKNCSAEVNAFVPIAAEGCNHIFSNASVNFYCGSNGVIPSLYLGSPTCNQNDSIVPDSSAKPMACVPGIDFPANDILGVPAFTFPALTYSCKEFPDDSVVKMIVGIPGASCTTSTTLQEFSYIMYLLVNTCMVVPDLGLGAVIQANYGEGFYKVLVGPNSIITFLHFAKVNGGCSGLPDFIIAGEIGKCKVNTGVLPIGRRLLGPGASVVFEPAKAGAVIAKNDATQSTLHLVVAFLASVAVYVLNF